MKVRALLIVTLLMYLSAMSLLRVEPARAQGVSFRIVSDGTAKYSDTEEPGWETLGFDDSAWPFVVAPSAGLCDPSVAPPGLPEPIWGEDPQEFQTIFVRKTFALDTAATANVMVVVDDDYDLFINGVFIGGNHDGVAGSDLYPNIALQAGPNILAMMVSDVAGVCQWALFDVFPTPAPPENDDVANAIVIPALDFTDTRDTRGATTTPDDPGSCSGGTNVWYTFTPSEDTFVRLSTAGSSYDASLDVFVNSAGGLSHTGLCAFGQLDFQASAGTTYYVMVSSPVFGGDLVFSVLERLVIGSISGRVVDALTGTPLPGDIFPFAFVELQRCEAGGCFGVNSQAADSAGRFQFSGDLEAGTYQVVASAQEYVAGQTEPFDVGAREDRDVGDVPLQPAPMQFSEIRPCGDLPPEGGRCRYSVRIHNRQTGPFQGVAWSVVESGDIGSFTGFTRFQPQRPRRITLGPEESREVHFSFEVPSTVRNGALICVQVFVGQGAEPFFDTVGHRDLFCLLKGFTGGFSVLAEDEVKALRQQGDERSVIPPTQQGLQGQAVPFTTQTRLTFDVVLPLWGHRGPRPTPTVPVHNGRRSAKERQPS